MTKDEALKIAVDYVHAALITHDNAYRNHPAMKRERDEIANDLEKVRQALEQPEQEPVAWVSLDQWNTGNFWPDDCFNTDGGEGMTPLYTAPIKRKGGQYAKECEAEVQRLKEIIDELENDDPPPQREWVGLTDEEILEAAGIDGADTWVFETAYAIEAKLKEKNT